MAFLPILAAPTDPAAGLGIVCCGFIFGLAIGVPIGAVLLRAAVKWVLKFDMAFGSACLIVLAVGVVNWIVSFLTGLGFGFAAAAVGARDAGIIEALAVIISLPITFLISSALYGILIKYPRTFPSSPQVSPIPTPDSPLYYAKPPEFENRSGLPIGFNKGMFVTLVIWAIVLAIVVVLGGIIFAVITLTGTRL